MPNQLYNDLTDMYDKYTPNMAIVDMALEELLILDGRLLGCHIMCQQW